jgi:hypothetical protein
MKPYSYADWNGTYRITTPLIQFIPLACQGSCQRYRYTTCTVEAGEEVPRQEDRAGNRNSSQ